MSCESHQTEPDDILLGKPDNIKCSFKTNLH